MSAAWLISVFRRDFCAHCLLVLTELHSGALLEGEVYWRVKVCFYPTGIF